MDVSNVSVFGNTFSKLDLEEREALGISLDDLQRKIAAGTPTNIRRSAPWPWRLKRAWRALKGKY